MTTILDHIRRSITDGLDARLDIQNGVQGVTFFDENEFIPLDDLNYNPEYGYFRISQFPNIPRDCENAPVDGRVFNRGTRGRTWAENTHPITGYIPPEWAKELVRLQLGDSQSDTVRTAIDIALHPFEETRLDPIRLPDPLPCGIRTGDGNCGSLAYVAYVYPWRHPVHPGHFVILPVCRECAEKAAEVYR